jgi:imidazolonepropionase-like amidohydrolase
MWKRDRTSPNLRFLVTLPAEPAVTNTVGKTGQLGDSRLSADQLHRMAEQGIALTPTLAAFQTILVAVGKSAPVLPVGLVSEGTERAPELIGLAGDLSVPVLCGTDGALEHGAVAREILALIGAGMEVPGALRAATVNAWTFLGFGAQLCTGSVADLIAFDSNPLDDPTVLLHPRVVIRAGEVVFERPARRPGPLASSIAAGIPA